MVQQWTVSEKVSFESDIINAELAVSPWSGHRLFAYDFISFVRPQKIVELGTHYGCSFFSFLQACKDQKLDTEIIAIDCWSGDTQAGFYGDEVIETVQKTVNTFFKNQNCRLIRKLFMEALADVEDESVDLLHIDGLHTYEAVSEDYNSWLCKLKPDGIVLFHDVASEKGYGTNQFWKELCVNYPYHYYMPHSWGLGILFPKGEKYYHILEKNNLADKLQIYEYRARYELAARQLEDHVAMVLNRDQTIAGCEAMIRERDEAIRSNEAMIQARDEAIQSNEAMIQARDEAIRCNEAMIRERDELIRQLQNNSKKKKHLRHL